LFSAVDGVEPQSETVWRQANRYKVPRIGFVNKMDRSGADFLNVVKQVRDMLGAKAVPLQLPIGAEDNFKGVVDLITMKAIVWEDATLGMTFKEVPIPDDMADDVAEWRQALIEAVADYDENLLEKFMEDEESITEEEINNALRAATMDMAIIPMIAGSAFKNKGVQFMLDAVCKYLPSPMDKDGIEGIHPDDAELLEEDQTKILRKPDVKEPFAALAFKIATDPFVGRLAFFRAYSGRLDAGSYVLNTRSGNKERISRIYQMHANKQNPIDYIEAGDIGAAVGFKDIKTGDTLCDEKHPIILESMKFPAPVIGIAIEPKTKADVDKMGMALAKLAEEDPTFTVRTDEASGQTIISGMGELHLDILVDRMRREFKVEVNQGEPQVEYKEAFTKSAQHREVYKKQSGGRGKFGDIVFKLEPADEVDGKAIKGLQFINAVKGGNVPKEYIPSVEKGFREAMKTGPLAGYQVDSLKVTLLDGSFHPVDSDALSFELAARMGYREVAKAAGAVVLEPIMKMEVITPEENMGDIVGDINRRRGQVNDMGDRAGAKTIKADVPLSEMFGYVTTLRTLSSGRATSTMEFSHYAETPSNISEAVIKKAKGNA
jgi:elongation factor G